MATIHLPKLLAGMPGDTPVDFQLPRSKSESNRLLVLQAVAAPGKFHIQNLSDARDTELLSQALRRTEGIVDVQDAGTAMRFATAYHALKGHSVEMRGTDRMHERPIGPLVEALKTLGAQIDYLKKEGYPPLRLLGFRPTGTEEIALDASQSSQFATALMLCAPLVEKGLTIHLVGTPASASYVSYTLDLLHRVKIPATFEGDRISIPPGLPAPGTYETEADWSSAGYAFSLAGLIRRPLQFSGLHPDSSQADRAILSLFARLGVQAHWEADHLILTQGGIIEEEIEIDFTLIPDQAQTFAAYCAAKGIRLILTGLQTLRIKETDRIAALQQELAKLNCHFEEVAPDRFVLHGKAKPPSIPLDSHHDHRMAMSFGVLSGLFPLKMDGAESVSKSFPNFWAELAKLQ